MLQNLTIIFFKEIYTMKPEKIALSVLNYICITSIVMANAIEYIPKGPKETEEFEKRLYELLPGYVCGIYPKDAILAKGVSEKNLPPESAARLAEYKKIIETWLNRVLHVKLKPKRFNKGDWLGIRKLHWDTDYIVGRFVSASEEFPYKGAIVEFQADDRSMDLTITSPLLLTADANGLSDANILNFTSKILNIPQEELNKIKIEKYYITVAGIDLCNGKMQCEWDERDEKYWRPDELIKREWWSYIAFWYIKGKMVVHISTIEWKKGDLPASTKSSWVF